ncbi:MAG: GH39 family glycosyl hydrolase [Streptosporangiaceae bacterium]
MGARTDWERRIGRRGVPGQADGTGGLAAPGALRAAPGRGHVTLEWDPVPGAAGYLVYRADRSGGPFEPLDHGGGDVLAVPAGPYADTSGQAGRVRYYAVAAVADGESAGPRSAPVAAAPGSAPAAGPGPVRIDVGDVPSGELGRPWEPMIGSEHLSYLLREDRTGGRVIGTELRKALRIARDEFGVRAVRAHGILCDDLGVYTESQGRPAYSFDGVDRVYDTLMEDGLRPVVELSFMPAALARDPSKTVFNYEGIISPPRNWSRWRDLVRALADHLLQRYGEDEVTSHWAFEVWNEPNIGVFWSGTAQEYFRLYDTSAGAVKSVHPGLRVGGPASAATGWVRQLLAHVGGSGAPLDFVSTHVYGNVPLDMRPALAAAGREGTPIWWTEWGATPSHFNRVGDSVFAAAFLLRGMASALDRVGALSHWVASDHFEELGPPPELFHGGFGLLSVGNLRKPRYWALALLARLGPHRLPVHVSGDGALGLVDALAARHDDGRIGILAWNGTLDQGKIGGDPVLSRAVRLSVYVPPGASYTVRHYRIDAGHSNIVPAWEEMRGGAAWPSAEQWAVLREANRLEELVPPEQIAAAGGVVELAFSLPMPGVSYLELAP